MSQQELLKKTIAVLERAGIAYMITGSIASSIQGEPRSSHDIDIVVALRTEDAPRLTRAFPAPEYYLDTQGITDAIDAKDMFNLIHSSSGDKVDFWLLTEEPFDKARFARRITMKILDMGMVVSAPEDTILAKLRWAALAGGSEKQFTDALRVFEVQRGILDMRYIEEWAHRLNLVSSWRKLLEDATPV